MIFKTQKLTSSENEPKKENNCDSYIISISLEKSGNLLFYGGFYIPLRREDKPFLLNSQVYRGCIFF